MGDIKAARYIRAVERMGSFSAAADELGISQPALSTFLKHVEKRLGSRVFDRSSTPIALTEVGTAYLEYVDSVESLKRDLDRKISDIEDLRTGSLVVGGTASFTTTLMSRPISEFASRYPGINVSLITDTLPNLAKDALDGRVDVFMATSVQDSDAFDCVELGRERFFLCVPSEWPVCEKLPQMGEDGYAYMSGDDFRLLDGCVFVSMNDGQQMGEKLHELLQYYDVHPGQIVRANQSLTCLALVDEGLGASLVTEATLRCCSLRNPPKLFLFEEHACTRTLYAAVPRNRSVSRSAREFVRILEDIGLEGLGRF